MKIIETTPDPTGFAQFEAALAHISPDQAHPTYSKKHFLKGYLLEHKEIYQARIALYQHPDLQLDAQPVLTLGAYACKDNADMSAYLLEAVFQNIRTQFPDIKTIVGPMEGTTWENYRFVLPSPTKSYTLEPMNPTWYPAQWEAAGFEVLKKYQSNLAHFSEENRKDISAYLPHFEALGVRFRNFNSANAQEELEKLADFNITAFDAAFLYTPIDKTEFVEKYKKILPLMRDELVILAEQDNRIVGMIFCIPEPRDPERKQMIVKTLARLPNPEFKGMGEVLCQILVNQALDLGFNQMIHALMRVDNASMRTSDHFWGSIFREYVLMYRTL
jgi:L-amino acid N-acyltransferase YncA